ATKSLLILLDAGDRFHGGIQAGLAHFKRIANRERRLLLERLRPAIPELELVVERVQDGGGVPLAHAAADADRGRPAVGESASRILAGGASHGAGGGRS